MKQVLPNCPESAWKNSGQNLLKFFLAIDYHMVDKVIYEVQSAFLGQFSVCSYYSFAYSVDKDSLYNQTR